MGEILNEYAQEMTRAMTYLAAAKRTIFLGQFYGAMPATLVGVPKSKLLEVPVAENLQMGMSTGLALAGFLPISLFVRWNFLLLAADQLVNHLDKIEKMSGGGYKPKVIIRTCIGSTKPLDSRCQHTSDFTASFKAMLTNVDVVTLHKAWDIFPAYQKALRSKRSTILVEYGNSYI
jgi:pyruvate/2-oxoglutarate/acetoin dehydrogenase E1 component